MSDIVIYVCDKCGKETTTENIKDRGGETKCIDCGYRVLVKPRPPIVRKIQAT